MTYDELALTAHLDAFVFSREQDEFLHSLYCSLIAGWSRLEAEEIIHAALFEVFNRWQQTDWEIATGGFAESNTSWDASRGRWREQLRQHVPADQGRDMLGRCRPAVLHEEVGWVRAAGECSVPSSDRQALRGRGRGHLKRRAVAGPGCGGLSRRLRPVVRREVVAVL